MNFLDVSFDLYTFGDSALHLPEKEDNWTEKKVH